MVEIIAEAGKNFIMKENYTVIQCLDEAKNYVRIAKEKGADTIKFQCHVFEDEQYKRDKSRHEWIKKNEELTPMDDFWMPLKKYCDKIGINFLVTPMSRLAAEKIGHLVDRWKISSADIVDDELLKCISITGKPVILSTGMSTIDEIENAFKYFDHLEDLELKILHCTSIYPCPIEKINLKLINHLRVMFHYNIDIGFSDHTKFIKTPAMAVKKGAKVIEKHFTLDKFAYGPDHHMSLNPKEFGEMVDLVRDAELECYADGNARNESLGVVYKEEEELIKKFRK